MEQQIAISIDGNKKVIKTFETLLRQNEIEFTKSKIKEKSEKQKKVKEKGYWHTLIHDNEGFFDFSGGITTFVLAVSPTVIQILYNWYIDSKSTSKIIIKTDDGTVIKLEAKNIKELLIYKSQIEEKGKNTKKPNKK